MYLHCTALHLHLYLYAAPLYPFIVHDDDDTKFKELFQIVAELSLSRRRVDRIHPIRRNNVQYVL